MNSNPYHAMNTITEIYLSDCGTYPILIDCDGLGYGFKWGYSSPDIMPIFDSFDLKECEPMTLEQYRKNKHFGMIAIPYDVSLQSTIDNSIEDKKPMNSLIKSMPDSEQFNSEIIGKLGVLTETKRQLKNDVIRLNGVLVVGEKITKKIAQHHKKSARTDKQIASDNQVLVEHGIKTGMTIAFENGHYNHSNATETQTGYTKKPIHFTVFGINGLKGENDRQAQANGLLYGQAEYKDKEGKTTHKENIYMPISKLLKANKPRFTVCKDSISQLKREQKIQRDRMLDASIELVQVSPENKMHYRLINAPVFKAISTQHGMQLIMQINPLCKKYGQMDTIDYKAILELDTQKLNADIETVVVRTAKQAIEQGQGLENSELIKKKSTYNYATYTVQYDNEKIAIEDFAYCGTHKKMRSDCGCKLKNAKAIQKALKTILKVDTEFSIADILKKTVTRYKKSSFATANFIEVMIDKKPLRISFSFDDMQT